MGRRQRLARDVGEVVVEAAGIPASEPVSYRRRGAVHVGRTSDIVCPDADEVVCCQGKRRAEVRQDGFRVGPDDEAARPGQRGHGAQHGGNATAGNGGLLELKDAPHRVPTPIVRLGYLGGTVLARRLDQTQSGYDVGRCHRHAGSGHVWQRHGVSSSNHNPGVPLLGLPWIVRGRLRAGYEVDNERVALVFEQAIWPEVHLEFLCAWLMVDLGRWQKVEVCRRTRRRKKSGRCKSGSLNTVTPAATRKELGPATFK